MINLNKKDSVSESIKQIMEKELSAKQKAIAKMSPPDDKIDAADLAKLRSGEKPVKEEIDVNDRTEDDLEGRKKTKKKDDVGPAADGKSTKVRFHAGPKNESVEPMEKVLAHTAPQSGIVKTVKGVDGVNSADANKEEQNKKKLKMEEDTEQLDEKKWIAGAISKPGALHKQLHVPADKKIPAEKLDKAAHAGGKLGQRARLAKTLKSFKEENENHSIYDQMINEVLSKDATAGDWIHDFVHSDNPKFAGKSKEQRKKMALAAYYAKQRNEEVEQVEEGWDEMMKAAKERSGPQPSGGSGVKKGSRYGGSKQKEKPEQEVKESKRPESDNVPFITDDTCGVTPMSKVKTLAKMAMKKVKKDLTSK